MTQPHPRTEAWLREFGVTAFELRDIPIERWNREASLRNQARLTDTPITDEVANTYALAMIQGDEFPPVVVEDTPEGYVSLDGNHRLTGADIAEKTDFPAYVVSNITQPQRLLLTFDANTRHGLRTSNNERLQQAAALVNAGVTLTEAARTLNVNGSTLSNTIGAQNAEAQLAAAGINTTALSRTHLVRLSALSSTTVRSAAARWFIAQRVGVTESSRQVNTIRHLPNEAEQLEYISRESARNEQLTNATARGRVPVPPSITTLRRALNTVDRINVAELTRATSVLPTEHKAVLSSRAQDAVARLRRVVEALNN
jgi:transposase-like protein